MRRETEQALTETALLLWVSFLNVCCYEIHIIPFIPLLALVWLWFGIKKLDSQMQRGEVSMSTLSCQSASNGDKVVTSEQSLYECMSAALRQTNTPLFIIWNQVFTNFTGRMYPLLSVKPDCFFGFFLNMSHVLWAHLWSRQGLMSTALSRERGKGRERERERLVECFHEPHFRSSRLATSKNREQGRRSPGMFKKEFWGCEWDARSLQGHRASCVYSLIKNARIQTKTRRRQEHIN